MFTFEYHRHILRAGDPTDLIGDLLAQLLLQLQAMSKLVRNPREFRVAGAGASATSPRAGRHSASRADGVHCRPRLILPVRAAREPVRPARPRSLAWII